MPPKKRNCASCKFFNEAPLPNNGWCTHPKRQLSSEVRILVRSGELACRNSWGGDQWVSWDVESNVEHPAPETHDRLVASARVEDRVTSVTTSPLGHDDAVQGDRDRTSPAAVSEDMIVSRPSMLPEAAQPTPSAPAAREAWDDPNLPAHEDQQERVRVIARGNRDAIVRARERHASRRGHSVPDTHDAVPADAADHDPDATVHETAPRRFVEHVTLASRSRQDSSRRLDQPSPTPGFADAAPPVPMREVSDRGRQSSIVSRRSDADRFESVPDVKPDVALPRLRQFLQGTDTELEHTGDEAPLGDHSETSYDRVLRRAQSIKSGADRRYQHKPLGANGSGRSVAFAGPSPAPTRAASVEPSANETVSASPAGQPRERHRPMVLADIDETYLTGPADEADWQEPVVDDLVALDDDLEPDDDITYDHAPAALGRGPQLSWWRGLNLGFGRRSSDVNAERFTDDDDEDWLDDEPAAGSSKGAAHGWSVDRREHQGAGERAVEREFSFSRQGTWEPEPVSTERDPRAAEDELIDYELTDEVLETSFADDGDSVRFDSWRDESPVLHVEREAAPERAPRPDATHSFSFDDSEDLDAFRAALFGKKPAETTTTPPAPVQAQRRRREPAPVPRAEVEAGRPRVSTAAPPPERRSRPVEQAAFDIRDFVRQDGELLDMSIRIAPDVPKACQTCRDFRPSESGERGWCTNDFAFAHRQMVNADDLPCRSSIGCWWLPSDATWLEVDEPSVRDQPTPRTDRLVAHRSGREFDDQAEQELYVREM